MKTCLLLFLGLFGISELRGAEAVTVVLGHDIRVGRVRVMGDLGVPIGDYITVEGVPLRPSKGGRRYPSFEDIAKDGVGLLEVYSLNGTPLARPVVIHLTGERKFTPANVYVLRGFQTAVIGPIGLDPEGPKEIDLPQVTEPFPIRFTTTKVLKAEMR